MEEREESNPTQILFEGISGSQNLVRANSVADLNSFGNLTPKLSSMFQEVPAIVNQAAMQRMAQTMSVMHDLWQGSGAVQAAMKAGENLRPVLGMLAERCLEINSGIFDKMRDTARRFAEATAFLRCCKETNWPIYWDCEMDFEGKIAEIELRYCDGIIDEPRRKEMVTEAILAYYDHARMRAIGERWEKVGLVDEGQQRLLSEAIERHVAGDYLASTAILACLSGGLTEKFYWHAFEAGLLPDEELSLVAEAYGVRKPSGARATARAQVFSLGLCTEQGALYWDAACKYIADTMLTSEKDWELLADDNPLRNKICHGLQTNYGTEVHSLKAILAVDLLLRLGAIVEEAAVAEVEGRLSE
ncbi:hypothetical protein [Adlercreutzia caecimuris]|jgi:hypothetical protein|uniref:hypothetical protein n=1 Tax=Adlercreutzia caecimuris TaxID=671266 RepID=UPI001C3E73E1|nr:hypothetical protein [Adlercreutzia caecimuris]MCR2037666.1 hypothetical protein [Adlercreutzia caecimuris]